MKFKVFYATAFAALLGLAACGNSANSANDSDTQSPAPVNIDSTEIIVSETEVSEEIVAPDQAAKAECKDCKSGNCDKSDPKAAACDNNCKECTKPECVKDKAKGVVEKGKEKGKEVIEKGKEKGKEIVAEGKEKGKNLVDKAKDKAKDLKDKL